MGWCPSPPTIIQWSNYWVLSSTISLRTLNLVCSYINISYSTALDGSVRVRLRYGHKWLSPLQALLFLLTTNVSKDISWKRCPAAATASESAAISIVIVLGLHRRNYCGTWTTQFGCKDLRSRYSCRSCHILTTVSTACPLLIFDNKRE